MPALPQPFTDSRIAVQGVALSLLFFGLACDEPTDPPGADDLSQRTQAAPRCSGDDECVVATIAMGDAVALHRDQEAPSFDQTVEGVRAAWAPPEEARAYCASGQCALDQIRWPDFRRCEAPDQRCLLLEDPCGEPVAVLATLAEEARSTIASTERREMCAGRSVPPQPSDVAPAAPAPRCRRGFCR